MNTEFRHVYRDASNFKQFGRIVLSGTLSSAETARLRRSLHDGQWFIASQVRLPELFLWEDEPTDADHV